MCQKEVTTDCHVLDREAHVRRHQELFAMLEELTVDWLRHAGKMPHEGTALDLMDWAFKQTTDPTERE